MMNPVKIYRNTAHLKDIDLFYFDTKTSGPAIVCLHGRCGRAETWYDFIQNYGERYRIIAPDQRGHGLSSKPESDYTDRVMADDVVELLDFLQIDSAIVAGHSMGGAVAGYLAAFHPKYVKAAAILDESAAGPEKALPADQETLCNPVKDWPLPFSSRAAATTFIKKASCSNLEFQYFLNSLTETAEGYVMLFSQQAIANGIRHYVNWYHLLPKINCPTLLVRSQSHEAVSDEDFQKMQSMLSNCLACEMSDPDHNVHLANKEEFYRYFDAFLSRL